MSEQDHSDFDQLTTDQMLFVNRICDRFETQWEPSGKSVADFISEMDCDDEPTRTVLTIELITLDAQYRVRDGLQLPTHEYFECASKTSHADVRELIASTQRSLKKRHDGFELGQEVAGYVVQECIGRGGMGQVYRARHELMQRDVAVKVLLESLSDNEIAQRRFHREVRSVAKMAHPNVVTAFDAREFDGALVLVTEWIDGQNLSQLVAADGPLPEDSAIECIVQAARGLQYAHEMGFIHRDVKPSNLLIDGAGHVKVLDLGLARLKKELEEHPQDSLTKSNHILGTVEFLAPEQARSPDSVDARSDIYSLGCTLFFLLTGKPPYPGATPLDTLVSHASEDVPVVREIAGTEISDKVNRLLQRMMSKQPSERPASMQEVIDELESPASAAPIAQPAHSSSEKSQRSWLLSVLGAAVLAACLLAIWFSFQGTSGVEFNGTSSYAKVLDFDLPLTDPCMIEVVVTPKAGNLPANIVTWTGDEILVLFAGFDQKFGIALLHDGDPRLEVATTSFNYGQTYVVSASWDGEQTQLWVDGQLVTTNRQSYPLVASEQALCFGGIPLGLLPRSQGTRFFRGVIHKLRISQGLLPTAASHPDEVKLLDTSIAYFALDEGTGDLAIDRSAHHWKAQLINTTWHEAE